MCLKWNQGKGANKKKAAVVSVCVCLFFLSCVILAGSSVQDT